MTGSRLAIAPHIRLCSIDDQVIVLDLLNNRYAGMAGRPFAALGSVLGWPSPAQQGMFETPEATALIEPLRARGWIVETSFPPSTHPIDSAPPEATRTLLSHGAVDRPLMLALRCVRSAISASWRLRQRSLFAIAEALAESKKSLPRRVDGSGAEDLARLGSAYLQVRPLVFSARDRCLHDSLTLVTFLAAQGLAAQWVIGVRIRPFAAHSWVQHDGLVLNDQHERVRAYRPIFVA